MPHAAAHPPPPKGTNEDDWNDENAWMLTPRRYALYLAKKERERLRKIAEAERRAEEERLRQLALKDVLASPAQERLRQLRLDALPMRMESESSLPFLHGKARP